MSIPRFTGENYGSLILIEYAPAWQISSFTRLSKSTISAAGIVFHPGYDWEPIYCSQDTMGHQQTQSGDDGGDSWQQKVVGFIPGDEDLIEQGLQQLHDQRYLVRVTRPNGVVRIVGTYSQPLEGRVDSTSQNTVPGTPGTSIQFAGITSDRALVQV